MSFELRETRENRVLTTLEDGFEVAEESGLSLLTSEPLVAILWNGKPLEREENYGREPWGWARNAHRWHLQLTDQVGRNRFTLKSRSEEQELILYVYPVKLSSDPATAWSLLRHIVGRVPRLAEGLGFPQELRGPLELRTQALEGVGSAAAPDLHALASRLYALSERLLSAPTTRSGRRFALERGGRLSGAVDWEATLDHWGSGGMIGLEHVLGGQQRVWNTPAYRLLLHLWGLLGQAAQGDSRLERGWVQRVLEQRSHYLRAMPGVGPWRPRERGPDVPAALLALLEELQGGGSSVAGLPRGSLGMAALFEVWVACELAALLGCDRRTALEEHDGQLACTFEGREFRVDYNIPFQFRGVGRPGESFGARPDLVVRSSDPEERIRWVADVKYRNLARLEPAGQRAINNQMRAYMGDYYARLGLVLWPGAAGMDPLTLESRGPHRGSLGAMHFGPRDSLTVLAQRLWEALERVGLMGPVGARRTPGAGLGGQP